MQFAVSEANSRAQTVISSTRGAPTLYVKRPRSRCGSEQRLTVAMTVHSSSTGVAPGGGVPPPARTYRLRERA